MLDDLAVLELEDVDDRAPPRAGLANGVDMQDDVIAVDERALDLDAGVREFFAQERDEFAKTLGAVSGVRIVLDISVAHQRDRGIGVLLVDALLIEVEHSFSI